MPKASTLDELFLEEIRDLYDAEKQLVKALPRLAKAATSEDLRAAFEEHLEQTQGQVERLEQVFESLGEKARGKKCAAMAGLIQEGNDIAKETEESPVRDAGLIAAAQKVEHYEISGYGSARTHAGILGNEEAVRLLQETLNEEKETDEKLNQLAQNINIEANEADEEEEGEEMEKAGTSGKGSGRSSASGGRASSSKSTAKSRSAGGSRRS